MRRLTPELWFCKRKMRKKEEELWRRRGLNFAKKISILFYRQYVIFNRSNQGKECRICSILMLLWQLHYNGWREKDLEEWIQIKQMTEWIHHETIIWKPNEKNRAKNWRIQSELDFLWGQWSLSFRPFYLNKYHWGHGRDLSFFLVKI